MPLQQTSGNSTTDAYAGGVAVVPNYIEDVFSTYLYVGSGNARSINNRIDLSTRGGLVWIANRSSGTNNNLFDTIQGSTKLTHSNTVGAAITDANSLTSFNTNGFSLGTGGTTGSEVNTSGDALVSWTFRKQPKFFDVVTWTGTGSTKNISHSLGVVPGCIIVKKTSGSAAWAVYFSDNGSGYGGSGWNYLLANTSAAASTGTPGVWGGTDATSTQFTVGTDGTVNASGGTYVAYLFANNNSGGFGLTGTDNVISCNYYTGNGNGTNGVSVTLGWEPQWVLIKSASITGNWVIQDVTRGMSLTDEVNLKANSTGGESNPNTFIVVPNANGFKVITSTLSDFNSSGETYMFIAIRRGPMKVPLDSVFSANSANAGTIITTGFPSDLSIMTERSKASATGTYFVDRLRGSSYIGSGTSTISAYINSTNTSVETVSTSGGLSYGGYAALNVSGMTSYSDQFMGVVLGAASTVSYWDLKRAAGFFDIVCYQGTGSATTQNHNLTVIPELMIVKERNATNAWKIYCSSVGNTQYLGLPSNATPTTDSTVWNNTTPTTSNFSIGTSTGVNASGQNYVNYLFASCPGVSKIGTYTGNGTTQTINCGFPSGVNFVLIKRIDVAGNWYAYDTASGMTSVTDPYVLINNTAAEVATLGSVTSVSTGFSINGVILPAINTNAASYIYLAFA